MTLYALVPTLLLLQAGPAASPDTVTPATPAAAVEGPPDANTPMVTIEEVVVTGSRVPQKQRNTTQMVRTTEVDTQAAETPNRNLAELVAGQAGVFVAPLSRNDANWGSVGGLGPKYSVTLLDGLSVDSFIDGMVLDPWALDRVESYQGPAGVMYGNALSMDFAGNQSPLTGATNYVLRDRIDTPLTRLSIGGGSWGTFAGRAYTQGKSGPVGYFVGGSYEHSDYTNYGTPDSWLHIINFPGYEKTKVYGKVGWEVTDGQRLSLFANHASHVGSVGRPNRDYQHAYDLVNASWNSHLGEGMEAVFRAGLRRYDRCWSEDQYPVLAQRERDRMKELIVPADATVTVNHLGESTLTAGIDLQWLSYETTSAVAGAMSTGNDAKALQLGIFAEEKWVTGPWVVRGGARLASTRHDYTLLGGVAPGLDHQSWANALWSAGIRRNDLGPVAVFANVGTSFVAPSAKAVGGTLRSTDANVAGMNGQLPNPDLKPEHGIGGDVGAELRFTGLRATVRGFFNQVDDAIVDNAVSQDPSQTRSVNAGRARAFGGEAAIEHRLDARFSWFANVTFTKTRITNPIDPDQDFAEVPFVPDVTANGGMTIRLPLAITLVPTVRAVGRFYDSSSKSGRAPFGNHVLPGLQVSKAVVLGSAQRTLTVSADLNNVADSRHALPWAFQDPGFNFFVRAELELL